MINDNNNNNDTDNDNDIKNININICNKTRKDYFNSNDKQISYYQCKKYVTNPIILEYFEKNKIIKSSNENDWNLFLPCTYNNLEKVLSELKINNNNKYIFGIKGCDMLASKSKLWKILNAYFGRENASSIMPESFVVKSNNDMELFKEKYKKGDVYILKNNLQRKRGLKLSNNYNELVNIDPAKYVVIQKYKSDPFIINKRKINIRAYFTIICYKKIKYYLLHDEL